MSLTVLLALLVVGLAVGFTSGLIGIGGGVLIVPFLYFFYEHAGWSDAAVMPALHTPVAHATSLFIIIPTALLGLRNYARSGLVEWRAALPIGIYSVPPAIGGAYLAVNLPETFLRLLFGLLLVGAGAQLTREKTSAHAAPLRINRARTIPTGVLIGLLSAMLGVGGGLFAMPLLIYLIHLDMKKTAATSLAIVAVAATAGTITYLLTGLHIEGMPPGSLGYVHTAAAVPIILGSLVSVRAGTELNQRMHSRTLRLTFAVVFIVMGLQMVWKNASGALHPEPLARASGALNALPGTEAHDR